MQKFTKASLVWILAVLLFGPTGVVLGEDTAETSEKAEPVAPKSELDTLKAEWEAVREQQIQMIREKEDQLEKLKEELFAKMKASNVPTASPSVSLTPESSNASELEAQKAALQDERQKFFEEMSRQKESLRQQQSDLDEKAKQLEAERDRFEQGKQTAAR